MARSSSSKQLLLNPHLLLLNKPRNLSQILQIHAQSITNSIFSDPFFATRLLFALSQLPNPSSSKTISSYADLIFSQFQYPNSFTWNTIIKIHTQISNPLKSIRFFVQMRRNGVDVDDYTYPFILNACSSSLPGLDQGGVAIHCELFKRGNEANLYVKNCLITFYCRTGDIVLARRVFDGVGGKDLVSWNSIMAGYAGSGDMIEAHKLFDEMPDRDRFSWAILIDGYGKHGGDVGRARQLFDQMPEKDVVAWNSMIDCHAGAGDMVAARELFDTMPTRNLISWSVLIDGHVRDGDPKEALRLFQQLLSCGMRPDRIAVVGAISACAQLGAPDQGRWLHSYLKKKRIPLDVVVVTALIDMYMKCGNLGPARRLFEDMNVKTVVSWNVMIVGLGINGHETEAVELFYRMEREGEFMDELTFLAALTACSHGGLIGDAVAIFKKVRSELKGGGPKVEHYGCMVDMFGRAGRLREALGIIEGMSGEPTPAMWGSLLAACRTHRCVELAEVSAKGLGAVGGDDCGAHVLMSNIYAERGMWDEVGRVRRAMSGRGMKKESGRSAVEIDGWVHEFVNGDGEQLFRFSSREIVYEVVWSLNLAVLDNG